MIFDIQKSFLKKQEFIKILNKYSPFEYAVDFCIYIRQLKNFFTPKKDYN